jgi:hypothetical protein
MIEPSRRYWAFFGNPRIYRVEEAISCLDHDAWTSKDSDIAKGDRVIFWRGAYGGRAGIVGLGEIEGNPRDMLPPRKSAFYFVNDADITREPRVSVRIVRPPKAPLWLHEDSTGVLASLSISKARGGTVFRIEPQQWWRVLELLGGWTGSEGSRSMRSHYRRLTKRIDARDRMAARAQRTEQAYLRKHFLGGNSHGPCCLCGRAFPVELLVAAHVKPRSACSPIERADPRNVVPMCRFGCDELFERKFVFISDGKVRANDREIAQATDAVRTYIQHLSMRACREWKRAERYFRWHAKSV